MRGFLLKPSCTKVFDTHTFYELGRGAGEEGFSFGRPLGLSMRGKKNGRVGLVMFLCQLIYVRMLVNQVVLKTTDDDQSSNVGQSFRIDPVTYRGGGLFGPDHQIIDHNSKTALSSTSRIGDF